MPFKSYGDTESLRYEKILGVNCARFYGLDGGAPAEGSGGET